MCKNDLFRTNGSQDRIKTQKLIDHANAEWPLAYYAEPTYEKRHLDYNFPLFFDAFITSLDELATEVLFRKRKIQDLDPKLRIHPGTRENESNNRQRMQACFRGCGEI